MPDLICPLIESHSSFPFSLCLYHAATPLFRPLVAVSNSASAREANVLIIGRHSISRRLPVTGWSSWSRSCVLWHRDLGSSSSYKGKRLVGVARQIPCVLQVRTLRIATFLSRYS